MLYIILSVNLKTETFTKHSKIRTTSHLVCTVVSPDGVDMLEGEHEVQ